MKSLSPLLFLLILLSNGCDSKVNKSVGLLGEIQNAIHNEIQTYKNVKSDGAIRNYFDKENAEEWHEAKSATDERLNRRLALVAEIELAYKNIFSKKITNIINTKTDLEKRLEIEKKEHIFSNNRLRYESSLYKDEVLEYKEFISFLQGEFKEFSNISVNEFSTKRVIPTMISKRDRKQEYSLEHVKQFDIYANLFIAGESKSGEAAQAKYNLIFSFKDCQDNKIESCEPTIFVKNKDYAERVGVPAFKELTANANLSNAITTYPRLEALRRGGYALAIEDFNNDGILDMFVGQYGKAELLIGKADGTFEKAPEGMLPDITLAKSAAFIDLDGRGYKDLIVARFSGKDNDGDIKIYKNEGGKKFTEVKEAVVSNTMRAWAMPIAISDFNNDGALDFYVGFPGERDFSVLTEFDISKKYEVNGIFINKTGHKFEDSTQTYIGNTNKNVFPHGALATDITGNGLQDIIVIDDRKNLSPIYINEGSGKFTQAAKLINVLNYGYGMGVDSGDLNNSGTMDLIFSNIMFDSSERIESIREAIAPGSGDVPLQLKKALRLFTNDGKANFTQLQSHDLDFTGEGVGGISFIDYDGDGLLDIYVSNGLWSGSDKNQNLDSEFAIAEMLKLTELDTLQISAGSGENLVETRSGFMKTLQNDRIDGKTLSFGGHQRNRLFKNLGNNEFIEVGFLEGVDSIADGYIPVVADINRDGLPDLIIRNCDPGIPEAHTFPVVQYYQNQLTGRSTGVAVRLKGNKSNIHGIGAKIFLTTEDKASVVTTQLREIKGNNSAIQAPMVGYFSIPKGHKIIGLEVHWPSKEKSIIKDVQFGEILIEEPKGYISAN